MDSTAAKRHIFAMLDVDGDGVISREEYLARPERAAAALGREPGDPLVIAVLATHQQVYASMDVAGNGKVTFEEYAAWAGADAFDEVCRLALGALFDLADADADGKLTRAEFSCLRQALGNQADHTEAAFDALDADGDGLVDREAYLASIRAFVTGDSSPMAEALHGTADHSAAVGAS